VSEHSVQSELATPRQRILIFCLSGLGDVLLASPALDALSRRSSSFQLTLLTMFPSVKEYLEDQGFTSDVRFIDVFRWSKMKILREFLKLRSERFDVSILPYAMNRLEYNAVSFLVGARLRVGFRYRRQRIVNLPFLNHRLFDEDLAMHVVDENLRWASLLTGTVRSELPDELRFEVPPQAMAAAETFLAQQHVDSEANLVGIHPGCNSLKNQHRRCWPPEHFARLIENLRRKDPSFRFVLFEGPQDGVFADKIRALVPGTISAKLLPMSLVGALIRKCRIFLSNDSGLMHVAAACKVPTVVLFGPTNPAWVHPWKNRSAIVRQDLPCSPCFYYSSRPLACPARLDYACVRDLRVEDVESEVIRLATP